MKIIDKYLDDLYKNSINNKNLDLKEEMRQHLIESVNELKLEGLDEEEACKKAIERFDGGLEMQQELQIIIKELSTSLNIHKSTLKATKRIFGIVAIIGLLVFGTTWYYKDSLQKNSYKLTQEFNSELKKIAEKYDMTELDMYKSELEKLLKEDKFNNKLKLRDIYVADMEKGNTSLDSSKVKAKSVYSDIDFAEDSTHKFANYFSYDTKDFLDIDGNIVNPMIFVERPFYNKSDVVSAVSLTIGVGSLLGYIALMIKNRNI
ncbi:permease prefix domain 1-containing protein [[Clostridium] dakarense]|uniref:permease prefix domain 1-containing protein n=1 Tax=Faecalimicrobium dakarense TaxID=1301100 RepID=UPI0004B13A18|nr:permease prefix domain 1-containing protein [[Clostridium] dakarense]